MIAIVERLPIIFVLLMTLAASRCDNLHAESRDAALAAFEATRSTGVVAVCEPPANSAQAMR